ncbi:fumarate reductase flavoprotein subunit [Streptomyces thermoviolaceus subsp. thermoviolaceus]|uniref:FAD-binding protein n=1 Tax=Streptomyces thermoviolaceus subsp. thermoviolaceus TaxID=66860 RepID=A0ABX0YXA2_STRTL|nr:FAD-binding protein [Streptomyces thermoviolaceus]NJP16529.1 FAD-binding protein [Streptomyces thermoviolaceus subsp. thermoviolaceus]WTD46508.1 FAD-binding protein [Streptomyces thermoviolaceus]GHB03952.1 fumarate reductase flavoprotein subunit [Streptomyces thermoviolaceus subsp. thermoviolaceus]
MSGDAQEAAVDLVVAGAGGGLAGALRAAQAGLSVLVVDPDEQFLRGNNTSMSTAMVPGAGSRWQREAGIEDSPERFVADIAAKTHGTADPALAAALARISAPLVEWLADEAGLPLSLVTDFAYPGHSVHRLHTVEGRHGSTLLRHLYDRVRSAPGIDLLVPARLIDVERGAGGEVTGAVVEDPGGHRETIPTRAVLLATNGYGADRELVARHLPEIAAADYHGGQFSRGDGLRIGLRHGARAAYLDAYQGHAALARRSRTLVGWATIMHGAIMVDRDGRRFGDETTGYSEYAAALAARPEARGWIVLDRRIHDLCLPFTDFRQTVDAGALVWADDLDTLARRTGCDPAALKESIAGQAAQAGGSADRDAFGRTFFEEPLRAPYAAVEVIPALFHTQGGLAVDGDARVLTEDGSPVPGLFASGGAAHGISGHGAGGYLAGNGLLPALGLAWQAATALSHTHTHAERHEHS